MLLSGSIGVIILKKKSKIIYVLSDDHSNSIYCSNNGNNHKDISKFLKDKLELGEQILLEEVPRDGFELKELWPDSPHTQNLKNLFLETDNIHGIDIRPYLIPFSWDVFEIEGESSKFKNIKLIDYLDKLNKFFKAKGPFFTKIFNPAYKSIKLRNSGLGKQLNSIRKYYFNILDKIDGKKSVYYYFIYDRCILDMIDILCSNIMEFYTILLAFSTNKKSYIHTGLFHSNSIFKQLIGNYNFTIHYKHGTISYPPKNNQVISCTLLPNNPKFGII